MDNSQIFMIATAAILVLTIGGGVTLALVFYGFSSMLSGGAVAGLPVEVLPTTEVMALAAWKEERDANRARRARLSAAYRTGVMVLIWLGLLTALEFVANLIGVSTVTMFIIALVKAGIILQFFMHISSLWAEGSSH
jgi:heme/copper-type cytochrome/quinol oxidase subunit 4